jgi:hypothetical protein
MHIIVQAASEDSITLVAEPRAFTDVNLNGKVPPLNHHCEQETHYTANATSVRIARSTRKYLTIQSLC